MRVINLQPHAVVFPNGSKIEPSGDIARVGEALKPFPHPLNELGIPVVEQQLGKVSIFRQESDEELPFPERDQDVFYVVSLYVAQALPYRKDLLVPVGQLRDEKGRIVGCEGLAVVNAGI